MESKPVSFTLARILLVGGSCSVCFFALLFVDDCGACGCSIVLILSGEAIGLAMLFLVIESDENAVVVEREDTVGCREGDMLVDSTQHHGILLSFVCRATPRQNKTNIDRDLFISI